MHITTETFTCSAGDIESVGYLTLPDAAGPHPGVLVAPAFMGLSDLERGFAERLAQQGYAALAVDYYGGGKLAASREEARALKDELEADRTTLLARMQGGLAAFGAHRCVDASRLGAIGFCFGGKAVLDLARSGAEFRAGASFHGIFDAPPTPTQAMKAALLVLHGWDDPLAPPEAVTALAAELTQHCEDWQILAFGHTGHAFTNPAAGGVPGVGYSETADKRAWAALDRFLAEKLA